MSRRNQQFRTDQPVGAPDNAYSNDYNDRTNMRYGNERDVPRVSFNDMFDTQPNQQPFQNQNMQFNPSVNDLFGTQPDQQPIQNQNMKDTIQIPVVNSVDPVKSQMSYFPCYSEIPIADPVEEEIKKKVAIGPTTKGGLGQGLILGDDIHTMQLPEGQRMNIVIYGYPNDGKESLLATLLSNRNGIQTNARRVRDRMCIYPLKNRVTVIVPWDYNPGMYDRNNERTTVKRKDIIREAKIEYEAFKDILVGRIVNGRFKENVLSDIKNNAQKPRGNADLVVNCVLFCVDSQRFSKDLSCLKNFVAYCRSNSIRSILVMSKTDNIVNSDMKLEKNPPFTNIVMYGAKSNNLVHAKQMTDSTNSWAEQRDALASVLGGDIEARPMINYQFGISTFVNNLVFHLTKDLLHSIFKPPPPPPTPLPGSIGKGMGLNLDIFKGESFKRIEYSLTRNLIYSKLIGKGSLLKSTFYDEIVKKPGIVNFMKNPNNCFNRSVFKKNVEKDSGLINLNILVDVYFKYMHFDCRNNITGDVMARLFVVENSAIRNSRILGVFIPRDYVYPLAADYVERKKSRTSTYIPQIQSGGVYNYGGGFNISAPNEEEYEDHGESDNDEEDNDEEEERKKACVYFEAEITDPRVVEIIDKEWRRDGSDRLDNADYEFIDIDMEHDGEPNSSQTFSFDETRYLRLSFGNNDYWLTRTNYLDVHKKIEEFIQKEKKNDGLRMDLDNTKKDLKDLKKEFDKLKDLIYTRFENENDTKDVLPD